jgi:FixJ family two-component response regulator
MTSNAMVAIIDDDPDFRPSLARLLRSEGYQVTQFESADDFLAGHGHEQLACAIVDLRMPGLSGIELQRQLKEMLPHVAVVFLTGHAAIPDSVQAMRAGAVDFLEKPVAEAELFSAIQSAIDRAQIAKSERTELADLRRQYQRLTPREREVFTMVTAGLLNKQIAYKLVTRERTIKAHRRQVMDKLCAESLAHLVRMADRLGIERLSKEEREELSGRRFAPIRKAFSGESAETGPVLKSSVGARHSVTRS